MAAMGLYTGGPGGAICDGDPLLPAKKAAVNEQESKGYVD